MDDRELLAALEGLGLGRENHRAVLLLPLIEVAWADGRSNAPSGGGWPRSRSGTASSPPTPG